MNVDTSILSQVIAGYIDDTELCEQVLLASGYKEFPFPEIPRQALCDVATNIEDAFMDQKPMIVKIADKWFTNDERVPRKIVRKELKEDAECRRDAVVARKVDPRLAAALEDDFYYDHLADEVLADLNQ